MTNSSKLLTCRQTDSIKLEFEINLDLLFDTSRERERFEQKWDTYNAVTGKIKVFLVRR